MKYPKGINRILLFFTLISLFTLSACKLFGYIYENPIYGTWRYISVKKNRKSVFQITKGDTLQLSSNDTFNYVIQKAGKNASGTWRIIPVSKDSGAYGNMALVFTYFPKGNKRTFIITKMKKNKIMVFREGNLYFRFERIR